MPKNREFYTHGMREYYSVKGKHSCLDCKHCIREKGMMDYIYKCAVIPRNNSYDKRNFPYDNTACKEFQQ